MKAIEPYFPNLMLIVFVLSLSRNFTKKMSNVYSRHSQEVDSFNPSSSKSDQYQISPHNINTDIEKR